MKGSSRPLVLTWLALLALLSVSAGTALLPLGWINTAIGLVVALVKALLVALVFMRLRGSTALLRLAALAGVVTLALLFGLSGADYATRPSAPAQWQQPATVAPRLGSRSLADTYGAAPGLAVPGASAATPVIPLQVAMSCP